VDPKGKGLGHLFWQGFVSAELLLRSPEYMERNRESNGNSSGSNEGVGLIRRPSLSKTQTQVKAELVVLADNLEQLHSAHPFLPLFEPSTSSMLRGSGRRVGPIHPGRPRRTNNRAAETG
jgi:hypothetical protein